MCSDNYGVPSASELGYLPNRRWSGGGVRSSRERSRDSPPRRRAACGPIAKGMDVRRAGWGQTGGCAARGDRRRRELGHVDRGSQADPGGKRHCLGSRTDRQRRRAAPRSPGSRGCPVPVPARASEAHRRRALVHRRDREHSDRAHEARPLSVRPRRRQRSVAGSRTSEGNAEGRACRQGRASHRRLRRTVEGP